MHLIPTKKYTNIYSCRPTAAQIQIKNFKQSLFPFFALTPLYNFHIFKLRPLALTYIKMLKIEVGLRGQIDQKLKCYFSNNLFLTENIFYYYAILLLCFITFMKHIFGIKIINFYTETVLP